MIVSHETFAKFVEDAAASPLLAVDTETTGLRPYLGDKIFSIAIANEDQTWYLNFNTHTEYPDNIVLKAEHAAVLQDKIFGANPRRRFFLHNSKFDCAFLSQLGISLVGYTHDTSTVFRLIDNQLFIRYTLANCAKFIGQEKSTAVDEFIREFGLWEWEQIPGKDTRQKRVYYNQIPLDIISKYAEKDALITYILGRWQIDQLSSLEKKAKLNNEPSYATIFSNEQALSRTVFEMEKLGVLIDKVYCKDAIQFEANRIECILTAFKGVAGVEFSASPKLYAEVFKDETMVMGDPTPGGKQNPSFDSDVLKTFKHPAAKLILEYRDAKSKLDFYQGFLFYADSTGAIHANFNQSGTATGRFASSNPNLQNLAKEEGQALEEKFVVRRTIVPRPGFFFAMLDYDQMEYRLLLDQADADGLIQKVLGGLDVHEATAQVAGITRTQAKTTNFACIYGSGITALSQNLAVTVDEAKRIRDSIFNASPEIEAYIRSQKNLAEKRHYLINWFGRRYQFPDARFSYKATNYVIQGGCADVVKIAMNAIAGFLRDKKSKLVLTIHDELVIETHESEKEILPHIKWIMESVYPHKKLPLTVGVEHSFKSLADKVEGYPA